MPNVITGTISYGVTQKIYAFGRQWNKTYVADFRTTTLILQSKANLDEKILFCYNHSSFRRRNQENACKRHVWEQTFKIPSSSLSYLLLKI